MGIKVEAIENGDKRRVTEDYTYPDGVTIPEGFIFDGASCPRIFWNIVAPFKHVTCSARHDWDCKNARQEMTASKGPIGYNKFTERNAKRLRKQADKRYRKCKQERDSKTAGWLAWAGVRVGSFFGSGW